MKGDTLSRRLSSLDINRRLWVRRWASVSGGMLLDLVTKYEMRGVVGSSV